MERQKIFDAFDNITLSEESANRMLDNILASSSEISPVRKDGNMKKISRKPILIAAVVIVMLLTMGAVVVKLSVTDLTLGEYIIPEQRYPIESVEVINNDDPENQTYIDESTDEIVVPETKLYAISIQNINDSPSGKAVQEWIDFKNTYDPDYSLLIESTNNGFTAPNEYFAYGPYTQEMVDKIDGITEKYGLELLGINTLVQKEEKKVFFDTLGIKQLHREDADANVSYDSGYFYDCGTFQFHFSINIPDSRSAVSCDYRYSVKGYFDPVFFCVSDINNIEQWNYTTSDGTELLIIIDRNITDEDVAWLLCEKDDAFITIRLSQFSTDPSKTNPRENIENIIKPTAEYIADVIDFSIKPQV